MKGVPLIYLYIKGVVIVMKFEKNEPKIQCINMLNNFDRFLNLGQEEFCDFLKKLLNLDQEIKRMAQY